MRRAGRCVSGCPQAGAIEGNSLPDGQRPMDFSRLRRTESYCNRSSISRSKSPSPPPESRVPGLIRTMSSDGTTALGTRSARDSSVRSHPGPRLPDAAPAPAMYASSRPARVDSATLQSGYFRCDLVTFRVALSTGKTAASHRSELGVTGTRTILCARSGGPEGRFLNPVCASAVGLTLSRTAEIL